MCAVANRKIPWLVALIGVGFLGLPGLEQALLSQEDTRDEQVNLSGVQPSGKTNKRIIPVDAAFEKEIAPLLIKRCVECHNATDRSGGLDLTTRLAFETGGDSGDDLTESDLDDNYLWERVNAGEMPPEERGISRELGPAEKDVLRRWIGSGSPWPKDRKLDLYEFTNEVRGGRDWWSFQPIVRPAIPRTQNDGNVGLHNPIDAFVHEKHREKGLEFSPAASKRDLFRRLSFDVTGLPPHYEDLVRFVADRDPAAYEKQVERLLASPRFGEHFGRDWLDLVRYADTNGYERDAEKVNGWKYRDWVIESINADKPFDRFVLQQLAGDQIAPLSEENVVGTTMLRVGTWDDEPNDKLEYKYDRLEDLIHVTSTAFLGLTVKCARCHNHKFDPIPQADYYRMGSIFWPGDLIGNQPGKVKGFEVFAWSDVANEREPIRLLKKGNPRQPQQSLAPGFLSVVPSLDSPFADPELPESDTGRRLEFAKRLVDQRNPLVARVIVNRIWQHYFGHGIVRTPNNFGYKGDLPTHPKLLDWLASELIEQNWNLKPIHRLILTSRTYQQQSGTKAIQVDDNSNSQRRSAAGQPDPLNLFLSRMNRKRLSAEAIRDSLLSHAGRLNFAMGGRGFVPEVSQAALEGLSKRSNAWQPSPRSQQSRRGVYLYVQRSLVPPLMASFDFADTTRPCGQRDLTIVAPQALGLLNNEFVHRQSEAFAHAVISDDDQPESQIRKLWKTVYARDPSTAELNLALNHYQSQLEYYSRKKTVREAVQSPVARVPPGKLVLHLDADSNLQVNDQQRVIRWTDLNEQRFAKPADVSKSPRLVKRKIDGKSVVEFNGIDQFLVLNDQVIRSDQHTIVVVGYDQNPNGSREFFSNWNANGNSTSSVFLGLTDGRLVRYSDQLRSSSPVPQQPFILTAVTHEQKASIFIGHQLIGEKSGGLTGRNLKTPYVIGTQGNFGHEYLKGGIAELLVYDRPLDQQELQQLWTRLAEKYPSAKTDLQPVIEDIPRTPRLRALASVCHVLLNSNEAIFVD